MSFWTNMAVSIKLLSTKHFFPHKFLYKQNVFSKNVSKKVSSIHKKGVVCSVHANINISWQFSASSHHSQRTNLYMYLPEQYNRQNNSIALSQRFSVHFLSNYILNSGPIFFYSLPFLFIFLTSTIGPLPDIKVHCVVFCALVNTVSIGDATTARRRPELSED